MQNENESDVVELLQRKLDEKIKGRSVDINAAIQKIEKEGTMLNDFLVPTEQIAVDLYDGVIKANSIGGQPHQFSDFAVGQLADKVGVPKKYLKTLWTGQGWQQDLAINVVNEHAANIERNRLLVRAVDGNIRGILSDSYRRLNTMQIFIAFLTAIKDNNCVLVDAHSGETRGYLEVVQPNVQSIPTPNNGVVHMAYGAQIRNSDFGHGALQVNQYEIQIQCMNGMTTDKILREIHLGKRLPDDLNISETTYRKDTEAMASLVGDAMTTIFNPEWVAQKNARIARASGVEVNIQREVVELARMGVMQSEIDLCNKKLMEGNPEDGLQGGSTLWKLAQTIGAVGRDSDDKDRSRELAEIAGKVMLKAE